MGIKVRFWGCRGSIPSPMVSDAVEEKVVAAAVAAAGRRFANLDEARRFVRGLPLPMRSGAGGNSPCVEVEAGGRLIIIDLGSGARRLGYSLMQGPFGKGRGRADILLSHTHWDHIQGFPFFRPVYVKGNRFRIHGVHRALKQRLAAQHRASHFPVPFRGLPAHIEIHEIQSMRPLRLGNRRTDGKKSDAVVVRPFELNHPGKSYGYRIEHGGKAFVYASDSAFQNISSRHMTYGKNVYSRADALVFDSQFTFEECIDKMDWGHCSSLIGVDLAIREEVKRLILFHHDPSHDDRKLDDVLATTRKYLAKSYPGSRLEIVLGYEGLELEL